MKRVLFFLLCKISYLCRFFKNSISKRLLQKAYELEGIVFRGPISYIHHDAYIDCIGKITLGTNIVISTKAIILAHDHSAYIFNQFGYNKKHTSEVSIGNNCFIGAGAIILPGTNIGNYCIIGAGAVVKGNIPDYSVVVGNPCKIIKKIKSDV